METWKLKHAAYFVKVQKAKDMLAQMNQPTSKAEMNDLVLATIKLGNEMEKVINKWELRNPMMQIWMELKTFFA